VRLISATNADLKAEIAAGRFREDLYFRLNVIELGVPPLANRHEDAVLLAQHFLARHAAGRPLRFTPAAIAALERHDWPGNVRELDNRVQRAVLVCDDGSIQPSHLGLTDRATTPQTAASLAGASTPAGGSTLLPTTSSGPPDSSSKAAPPSAPSPASNALEEAERGVVESALARASGVVSRAAAELGLSRQALYRRMDRLGIAIERRIR
jgi:DNA-binding NtrC family response regulator